MAASTSTGPDHHTASRLAAETWVLMPIALAKK